MNRRDALRSLVSLPAVSSVRVADVKPNDVIVIESDGDVSSEGVDQIRRCVELAFPGRKAIVLTGGFKLSVARSTP